MSRDRGTLLQSEPAPCGDGNYSHSPIIDPTVNGEAALATAVADAQTAAPTTVLLRGGVHRLTRPLVVGPAAGALTIRSCPGEIAVIEAPADGPAIVLSRANGVTVGSLVFAGPSRTPLVLDGAENCLVERNIFLRGDIGITLEHARHNRIRHNVIHDVASSGIELKDGSDGNLVIDNVVDGVDARETFGGGIFLHGASDNRLAHNLIQRTAGFGIAVSNWDDATVNTGNVVEYNLLRQTVLDSDDSGAIYVLGRSGADTGIVIAGNVIDQFGAPGRHNVGIYLDDSTNGATVVGNWLRAIGSDAVQIHGGQDNLIEGNLLDIGAGRASAVLFQAAPADTHPLNRQTGNEVTHNVIVSSNHEPRPFVWYDGGTPAITDNLYVVPDDAAIELDTNAADQRPRVPLPGSLAPGADDAAIQAVAAAIIGFRPIDPAAAGTRRVR